VIACAGHRHIPGSEVTTMIKRLLATFLLLAALTACGTTPSAVGIHLDAALVTPVDVTLTWHDDGPAPAGHVVEYATHQDGPFTTLGFLPAAQTSYRHQNLMPHTTFYYRVRPYYGPASDSVDVTLPPGAYDDAAHADDQAWAAPTTDPARTRATQAIRRPATATSGAPTDLTAIVMNDNGVRLTWVDNARDEDGYLMEIKAADAEDFQVVQVMDPRVNSCGVATLPDEKRAAYRVRAFYYGGPSTIAHATTGDSSTGPA
jgi:hypothetical protein